MSNIGNQINAEGAKLIGDNGEILGHSGKILSHAVVAGISAEIAGGDAKGAAVGALAAELAAITMESRLFEPAYKNETERQIHKLQEALTGNEVKAQTAKFIGALSGALISHTPEGAYSAELVYRNNMTEHMLYQLSVENQKDILAAGKGDKAAEARVIARQDAAIAVTAVAAGGYALVYGGQILIAASAEMATAGRVALEGCKTNPALCLNNVGIFVADAVAPEAAVGTGVLAAGTVKVLGSTKEGAKNLAEGLSHTSNPLLSNAKSDTHAVASLIENEKLYIERNSSTATEAVAVGMAKNGTQGATNQLVDGKWLDANGLPLPVPPSVGAAGRVPTVLQTGGNTLNKSTANTLNNQLGENLTSREWGRALEALKKENGLRNDFHGRILDNGNYIDDAGKVIGNIGDYLP